MYTYTFILTYTGASVFVQTLWGVITRGSGQYPMSLQLTPAQAATLKTQGTNAGFAFSKIQRVPVPTAPEDVTGST